MIKKFNTLEYIALNLFSFTFGFSDGMAKAKPFAHMMKCLVAWVWPLIHVVARARPDQVVKSIIAGPWCIMNKFGNN